MTSDSVEPLRLNACPACFYCLQGLAEAGVCPECGELFDRAVVVLHGYARGELAHAGNAKPWVALFLMLAPLLQLVMNLSFRGQGWIALAIMTAVAAVAFIWRRRSGDAPGLVQVELSDAGCRQYDTARSERERHNPPTPWDSIAAAVVEWSESKRTVRIRLTPSFKWYQFSRPAVDAEIAGGNDLANALRARITAWTGNPSFFAQQPEPTGGFPVVIKPPPPS